MISVLKKYWLGFILAAFVPFLYLLLISQGDFNGTRNLLGLFIASFGFSILALLFLGLPIVYMLSRTNRLSLFSVTLAGSVVGPLAYFVFLTIFAALIESPLSNLSFTDLIFGLGFSFSMSVVFGLVARLPLFSKKY